MWWSLPAAAADLTVGPTATFATIDDAIDAAAAGDRIVVDPGDYDVREPDVPFPLEILSALGPGQVTVHADFGQSMFEVTPGGDLTLRDLSLDGAGRRIATIDTGRLALFGCNVTGTEAAGFGRDGGAVDAVGSTIVLDATTIDGSLAGRDGGIVHAVSTDVSIVGSTLRAGSAGMGGALALVGGTLSVSTSTIEACDADTGSAVWLDGGAADLADSTLRANTASSAGTLVCASADCRLDHVILDGNVAPSAAAASVAAGGALELVGSTVCRTGGDRVIDASAATLALRNDVFVNNDAGEALVSVVGTPTEVLSVHFVANTTTGSGAALAASASAVDLRNTLAAWNTAVGPVFDVPTADLTGGWSLFWQNATADLAGPLRATDIAADPLFPKPAAGTCDPSVLVPPAVSPATDAGDPGLVDADGTRSDIGAFGGNDDAPVVVVDDDADGWPVALDCDDTNAGVNPDALEIVCDGLDQDCDPATLDAPDGDADGIGVCDGDCNDDDADRSEYFDVYRDRDEDGIGTGDPTTLCGLPVAEASLVGGDCDDQNADRFPGNPEVPYDGVDQDCDGADLDDVDADGVTFPDDCDDDDADVFPGAVEVEDDGVDQDCTGNDAVSSLLGGSGVACGCRSGSGGSPGVLAPLLLVLVRRRGARFTSSSGTR